MSNYYRKIEYPCDCGADYYSCPETNLLAVWSQNTCNLVHLYAREHGVWRKLITVEDIKPLQTLINGFSEVNEPEELKPFDEKDWEEFEKVRWS